MAERRTPLLDKLTPDTDGLWAAIENPRLIVWGAGAGLALILAIAALFSERGSHRIAGLWNSPPEIAKQAASISNTQLASRLSNAELESRRLDDALRALAADRDRLITRISGLERNFDEMTVTGSIAPSGTGRGPAFPGQGQGQGQTASSTPAPQPTAQTPAQSPTQAAAAVPPVGRTAAVANLGSIPPSMPVVTVAIQPGMDRTVPSSLSERATITPEPPVPTTTVPTTTVPTTTAPTTTVPTMTVPTTTVPTTTGTDRATPSAQTPASSASTAAPTSANTTSPASPANAKMTVPVPPLPSKYAALHSTSDPRPTSPSGHQQNGRPAPGPANAGAAPATPAESSDSSATKTEFGIEVGGDASMDGLRTLWTTLKNNHMALFDGMRPLMTVREGQKAGAIELRLVAGPLANANVAARYCAALAVSGVPCQPVVFDGQKLALK